MSDQILGPIYTLQKADPETFSFWVNNIFAKKQVWLDVYGLAINLSKLVIKVIR